MIFLNSPQERNWRKVKRREMLSVVKFCKERETISVPFSSRIMKREKSTIFVHPWHGRIEELVMTTSHGLVLPILENRKASLRADDGTLANLIHKLPQEIYSIMGLSEDVNRIAALLKITPKASINYHHMLLERHVFLSLNRHNSRRTLKSPAFTVRRASVSDTERLLPMQGEYEREGVLLHPADFSENRCRSILRHSLMNEIVFIAEHDGRPISKACTNARGFAVDQIGGVFTCKELRNQGIAYTVMKELLHCIFRTKREVSLFVKKTNTPALALYKKLGFSIQGSYQIDYTH